MAKILFAWELGAGSGHIAPYINLVAHLEKQGHKVCFALKFLDKAHQYFQDTKVTYFQAPASFTSRGKMTKNTNSYAKILYNAGYSDVNMLTAMIQSWRNLYDIIKPDIIIFDYSPTAMLAARNFDARRVAIGTGFHLPPETTPVPGIWAELGREQDHLGLIEFESKILLPINEALSLNKIEPLENFCDLLKTDVKLFRSFSEMDHYQSRKNAIYSGVLKSAPGAEPKWPGKSGPKIFAYLKPFKALPQLLTHLNRKKFPTLIYGDGLTAKLRKEYASSTLHFCEHRLDMKTIGETADVAITNSGHGGACELLLSGVPSLLLPLNLEQHMVAQNIVRMKAGSCAKKLDPKGMAIRLKNLLEDEKYRDSAQIFATKYAETNKNTQDNQIFKSINSLLEEI